METKWRKEREEEDEDEEEEKKWMIKMDIGQVFYFSCFEMSL